MSTYSLVDLPVAQTERLSDLAGIAWDLKAARRAAQQVLRYYETDWPGHDYGEALTIAMTVMYCRPFMQGARYYLGEAELLWLSAEQRAFHQRMRLFRDKHIAHSVNAYEQNIVCARYCVERVREEGFTSLDFGGERVTGLDDEDVVALIALIDVLHAHVSKLMEAEQVRVLEAVRAMPIDEVLAFGRRTQSEPRTLKIDEPRKIKPRGRSP